jgi:hypothetical protein
MRPRLSEEPIVITDRGRPVLRLLPFVEESVEDVLDPLGGVVWKYSSRKNIARGAGDSYSEYFKTIRLLSKPKTKKPKRFPK